MTRPSKTTTTSGPRLVFFGNERLATGVSTTAPVLRTLLEHGYDIAAVINRYEPPRSRTSRPLEIQSLAEAHHIPMLFPEKLSDISETLRGLDASAGVLVAYGRIVPQSVIDIFPRGIINLHPSLLPKHRGPTPLESVILAGERQTGVTLMQLAKAMDAGPIYDQQTVPLDETVTKQDLADRLLHLGAQRLAAVLPDILAGTLPAVPQADEAATYDGLIQKTDGVLDWRKSAVRLEREVRAFAGWPQSRATFGELEVIVTRASAAPSRKTGAKPGDMTLLPKEEMFGVETADGTFWIETLKPAGKKNMPAKDFLRGYGKHLRTNS